MRISATGSKRGFTLLELMAALLIVALVLSLVMPKIGRLPAGLAIRRATAQLQQPFRDASLHARTTGHTAQLTWEPDNQSFLLHSQPAQPAMEHAENSLLVKQYPLSEEIEFPLAQPASGQSQWHFYANGESTGPDLQFAARNQTFTLIIDRLTGQAIIRPATTP